MIGDFGWDFNDSDKLFQVSELQDPAEVRGKHGHAARGIGFEKERRGFLRGLNPRCRRSNAVVGVRG